ncbi:MAG: hypothetical protein IIC24_07295, partial [Chloroflexi bacterium]|nr:hypothetical protein [Chloroflexota bacterium]
MITFQLARSIALYIPRQSQAPNTLKGTIMPHSHELTVVEAAKKIRRREVSPVTMMEDLLNRVSRLEPDL